jgi:hypothetical protein
LFDLRPLSQGKRPFSIYSALYGSRQSYLQLIRHCLQRNNLVRRRYLQHRLLRIRQLHLALLPPWRHIVFDFSHTFSSITSPEAHCIRFFAYIWSVNSMRAHYVRFFAYIWPDHLLGSTLCSVFRIHSARSPSRKLIVFDFSHTLPLIRSRFRDIQRDS